MTICVLGAVAAIHFRVADRAIEAADAFEALNLNGLFALAVLVPVATTIYAVRRYRDAMRIRSELARLSLRDELTGLPNRLFLSQWLDGQMRLVRKRRGRIAVLFVDLDRFKAINDTHGHDVGDAVLVAIALRLRDCLADPETDRVVRYSGDEFLVIVQEDGLRPTAARQARAIVAALDTPFPVGPDTLRVTASIGLALSDGDEAGDELIRRADAAMYDAKARGDGQPVTYDVTVHGPRFNPTTLEPQLRRAAEEGAFRLAYQPVVDAETGRMVGVEALLRWDHPERGAVSPAEFIPVLEESGLIVPVGAWVVSEAVRQAHTWHRAYPGRAPLHVAVNVSARQLAQSGFDEHVRSVLADHPIPPGALCLELTEGALMVDVDAAWSSLRQLKHMGVKLALDDFGTGYSSLSYIRNFSLDMLKIDRSFVTGLGASKEDTAIVEHVIGMARALGMVTVGEGVETPVQLAELRRLGCERLQGYLLSPPVAAAEIDDMLSRGGNLSRTGAGRNTRKPAGSGPPALRPPPAPGTGTGSPFDAPLGQPAGVATGAPSPAAER